MSEDRKREVHPIVKRLLEISYMGFDSVDFDDYALEELQEMLEQCYGKPELRDAVVDLINLARSLDERGAHSASMKLILVVSNAADALKALNEKK